MSEFMMLFHYEPAKYAPSPDEIEASIVRWQNWIGGIAAQGKFKGANQLGEVGKVMKSKTVVPDGPYAEVKEIVGGYLVVEAENMEEAMAMAKGCPIFEEEETGKVEIRQIIG